MSGVDVVSVKEILGHRDIETTMRYSRLSPAHLKEGVVKGSLGAAVLHTAKRDLDWDQKISPKGETVQPLDLLAQRDPLQKVHTVNFNHCHRPIFGVLL